jgi:hypothetical protein
VNLFIVVRGVHDHCYDGQWLQGTHEQLAHSSFLFSNVALLTGPSASGSWFPSETGTRASLFGKEALSASGGSTADEKLVEARREAAKLRQVLFIIHESAPKLGTCSPCFVLGS